MLDPGVGAWESQDWGTAGRSRRSPEVRECRTEMSRAGAVLSAFWGPAAALALPRPLGTRGLRGTDLSATQSEVTMQCHQIAGLKDFTCKPCGPDYHSSR